MMHVRSGHLFCTTNKVRLVEIWTITNTELSNVFFKQNWSKISPGVKINLALLFRCNGTIVPVLPNSLQCFQERWKWHGSIRTSTPTNRQESDVHEPCNICPRHTHPFSSFIIKLHIVHNKLRSWSWTFTCQRRTDSWTVQLFQTKVLDRSSLIVYTTQRLNSSWQTIWRHAPS